LRGKDVIFTFVESYGKVALTDPTLKPGVEAVLGDAQGQLEAAGFAARSAWMTSSAFGGGSWFAHSTLLSGLWINNQPRYNRLLGTDRLTLSTAFKRAGWHTVGVEPAVESSWPDGSFYGYDKLYDFAHLGYVGPKFGYAPVPDQFTLNQLAKAELAPGHPPLMAEITMVSSHSPWQPLPHMVDPNALGDGSIFDPMPAQWKNPGSTKADYGQSIEYSLQALLSFAENLDDPNLVLVFLGDHQPVTAVSGNAPSHDVPISIIAHDPTVMDRISSWGWNPGLEPAPNSPVWRMSDFRDRFLAAFAH
jgi:hypothetical protein